MIQHQVKCGGTLVVMIGVCFAGLSFTRMPRISSRILVLSWGLS